MLFLRGGSPSRAGGNPRGGPVLTQSLGPGFHAGFHAAPRARGPPLPPWHEDKPGRCAGGGRSVRVPFSPGGTGRGGDAQARKASQATSAGKPAALLPAPPRARLLLLLARIQRQEHHHHHHHSYSYDDARGSRAGLPTPSPTPRSPPGAVESLQHPPPGGVSEPHRDRGHPPYLELLRG